MDSQNPHDNFQDMPCTHQRRTDALEAQQWHHGILKDIDSRSAHHHPENSKDMRQESKSSCNQHLMQLLKFPQNNLHCMCILKARLSHWIHPDKEWADMSQCSRAPEYSLRSLQSILQGTCIHGAHLPQTNTVDKPHQHNYENRNRKSCLPDTPEAVGAHIRKSLETHHHCHMKFPHPSRTSHHH